MADRNTGFYEQEQPPPTQTINRRGNIVDIEAPPKPLYDDNGNPIIYDENGNAVSPYTTDQYGQRKLHTPPAPTPAPAPMASAAQPRSLAEMLGNIATPAETVDPTQEWRKRYAPSI